MLVRNKANFEINAKIAEWKAWFNCLQLEFAVKVAECLTINVMQALHLYFCKRVDAARLDMEGDAERIARTSTEAIVLNSLVWHMCCAAKENLSIQLQEAYLMRI